MNKDIYTYDGSFINLLNLIYTLYQNKIIPLNIKTYSYEKGLFDNIINLEIVNDESIINLIVNKFGLNIFNTLYKIYLSNEENKELLIYYFISYAIIYKEKVFYLRNNNVVNKSLKTAKYVGNENHKFKGFLRFKELKNNVLYGEISPENNILPLLVKHFKERLKQELWIIKDVNRKIYGIYDKKEVYIIDDKDFDLEIDDYSKEEENIQKLWKSFYNTIGIKERKNDRCRMNFMPKKYWKYIIEVRDEYEKSSK